MALNQSRNNRDNRNNRSNDRRNQGQQFQNRQSQQSRPQPESINPLLLPEDYVKEAEDIILKEEWFSKITTSKIRRLFSLLIDSYNLESIYTDKTLKPETVRQLHLAQIRMLYEAGRDESVKDFLESTKLVHYLKGIRDDSKGIKNDRNAFINYFHYMEALVAYHKYFGGKEA